MYTIAALCIIVVFLIACAIQTWRDPVELALLVWFTIMAATAILPSVSVYLTEAFSIENADTSLVRVICGVLTIALVTVIITRRRRQLRVAEAVHRASED